MYRLIVEDDTDSYETVMHRPEWAKASLTPVSTKELGNTILCTFLSNNYLYNRDIWDR